MVGVGCDDAGGLNAQWLGPCGQASLLIDALKQFDFELLSIILAVQVLLLADIS